jgi:hypothetical protein
MSNVLEENLPKASEGNTDAIEKVLLALIEGPVYVPNRAQSHKLSFEPQYPNNLVSILGIQDKERVIVPVFSSADLVAKWFGSELLYKEYSGKSLFDILPEDWWICINPGQEIEKDISPWEISRLKHGAAGIKEIIEEISNEDAVVQTIETKEVSPDDYKDLKSKLLEFAGKEGAILKMYVLLEKSLTIEEETLERLLIGLECDENAAGLEKLKEQAAQICGLSLIGNLDFKILAAAKGNNIILGVFKDTEPFYNKKRKAGVPTAVIVFGIAFILVLPWRMFLENLKETNSQLSTSFLVQLMPVFLALVIYGMIQGKQNKRK